MAVLGLCRCAGFSLLGTSGATLNLWWVGFSLQWLLLWISAVVARGFSGCSSQAPEHRLSNCGTWVPQWTLSTVCWVAAQQVGSSPIRDVTLDSCIGRWIFNTEPPGKPFHFCFMFVCFGENIWVLLSKNFNYTHCYRQRLIRGYELINVWGSNV